MTVLEHLVAVATTDPEWAEMIPRPAVDAPDSLTCKEWGRKGGSHYKDGQFTKK